jgi:hypothetical protein
MRFYMENGVTRV